MNKPAGYISLFRPWSLTATVVPFLTALAILHGGSVWRSASAFIAAALLQTACNLLNTYGDWKSGVDAVPGTHVSTPHIQSGAIQARSVKNLANGCLALAAVLAAPLFFPWNLKLCAIAAIGFLGASNYATGFKFKYRALGVVFVFSLMGWLECAGFIYAISPGFELNWPLFLLATLPMDCLVAAILHGNDMRDIETDAAAGIKTLSTMLGFRRALGIYRLLHIVPYCTALLFAALLGGREAWLCLLPFLALPLTIRTLVRASHAPVKWLERDTGLIHLVFSVLWLFALAAI